jgi:hypothetical protein
LYGGGGAGGNWPTSTPGVGAAGIIVITYTPSSPPAAAIQQSRQVNQAVKQASTY